MVAGCFLNALKYTRVIVKMARFIGFSAEKCALVVVLPNNGRHGGVTGSHVFMAVSADVVAYKTGSNIVARRLCIFG